MASHSSFCNENGAGLQWITCWDCTRSSRANGCGRWHKVLVSQSAASVARKRSSPDTEWKTSCEHSQKRQMLDNRNSVSKNVFPASHTTEQCLLHGNLLNWPQNTLPIMLEATGFSLFRSGGALGRKPMRVVAAQWCDVIPKAYRHRIIANICLGSDQLQRHHVLTCSAPKKLHLSVTNSCGQKTTGWSRALMRWSSISNEPMPFSIASFRRSLQIG